MIQFPLIIMSLPEEELERQEYTLGYDLYCHQCNGKRRVEINGRTGHVADQPVQVKNAGVNKLFEYNISTQRLPYPAWPQMIAIAHLSFVHDKVEGQLQLPPGEIKITPL